MQESDIFIHPGEWYFGDKNIRIRTVLGSCVAVTLWHPGLKMGGMCHYLLPSQKQQGAPLSARYGSDAIELMIDTIKQNRGNPKEYQAKVFGGSNMLDASVDELAVGRRNVVLAQKALAHYGLKTIASDVGGDCYRQLIFNIEDGAVWVRQGATREERKPADNPNDLGKLL